MLHTSIQKYNNKMDWRKLSFSPWEHQFWHCWKSSNFKCK